MSIPQEEEPMDVIEEESGDRQPAKVKPSFLDNRESIAYDEQLIRSFEIIRLFQETDGFISSTDISSNNELVVAASNDDCIVIYDCFKGLVKSRTESKKYGADLARFTRSNECIVHASTKIDDNIRYLSLLENKYIRYFCGHEESVVALRMFPGEEGFISGSMDNSAKIWDLKTENFVREISIKGKPVISFDPEGIVFAIGSQNSIDLFDARNIKNDPFSSFTVKESIGDWSDLKFSPDGQLIAITSTNSTVIVVDAFDGKLKFKMAPSPESGEQTAKTGFDLNYESSFSPGGEFLIRGDALGLVPCYSMTTGEKITTHWTGFDYPVACVQYHPTIVMFFTCSRHMNFWLPRIDETDGDGDEEKEKTDSAEIWQ